MVRLPLGDSDRVGSRHSEEKAETMRDSLSRIVVVAVAVTCMATANKVADAGASLATDNASIATSARAATGSIGIQALSLAGLDNRNAPGSTRHDLPMTTATIQDLGAMVLLGTALFALAGAARRRIKR
jgi:hypothetical protein